MRVNELVPSPPPRSPLLLLTRRGARHAGGGAVRGTRMIQRACEAASERAGLIGNCDDHYRVGWLPVER